MTHYYSISEIDDYNNHIIVCSKNRFDYDNKNYMLNWFFECKIDDKEVKEVNEQIALKFKDLLIEEFHDDKMIKYSRTYEDYNIVNKILEKYVTKTETFF